MGPHLNVNGEYLGSLSEDLMIKISAFLDLSCCCKMRINVTFRNLIDKSVLNKMSHVQGNQMYSANGCSSLIPHLVSLIHLKIPGCSWLNDALLNELAEHCPCLQTVDFSSCKQITDDGMSALAMGCRNIKEADLTFCAKTTYNSVLTLLDNCGADVVVLPGSILSSL